ncbi:MAG: hypothetical protein QW109_05705 [Sulfolobales archaeon]
MIKRWFVCNAPVAGEEWRPEFSRERPVPIGVPGLVEGKPVSEIDVTNFSNKVMEIAKRWIRNEDVKKAERVIEDPLAYYVPYHSPEMGIYFRINRMLSDFQNFIFKWGAYVKGLSVEDLWYVYVITILWHEMCHHVIEDVATLLEWMGRGKYPLMIRNVEEMFCEFNAFSTAERQLSPPGGYRIPIITLDRIPAAFRERRARRMVLSYLYYHWGRDDPSSIYRPRVDSAVPQLINGLWNPCWNAHLGGYRVIGVPSEVYGHVYCVTF